MFLGVFLFGLFIAHFQSFFYQSVKFSGTFSVSKVKDMEGWLLVLRLSYLWAQDLRGIVMGVNSTESTLS